MLRNGSTSAETALACGFSTYANFYKLFVSKTGLKPSDFLNNKGDLAIPNLADKVPYQEAGDSSL